ncbi:GIY-YIG nuclease family protein, partial [Janthinobacterium sp. GW456W]|uniref:GIY-YIG nuclease family protein n=3 Tax=Janthinobacterium TaxID=29580 RepID=UPI001483A323
PRYQANPARRPPRPAPPPLPYLPPRYRGWGGYPAIYPTLYPAPYPVAEPAFGDQQEPEPDQDQGQDQGQDDGQQQGEIPPTLAGTMGRVPEAAALSYLALGTLDNALRDPNGRGPGLYVIEFDAGGRRRAYSGQTDDLHRRLLQHRLCGQMMGVDLSTHQVYVAPLSSPAQRRRIEQRIHDDMFAHQRGVLTNQRRELELAVLGEMWS